MVLRPSQGIDGVSNNGCLFRRMASENEPTAKRGDSIERLMMACNKHASMKKNKNRTPLENVKLTVPDETNK